jgi:predicted nicotinamide N-methyase
MHVLESIQAAVILAHTKPTLLHLEPELRLFLANEYLQIWEGIETSSGRIEGPPFWAHAWSGGQALMRHIFSAPNFWPGKRVLDFASGCGVSALAAALCGAHVTATEIDPWACQALALNATLNEVPLDVLSQDVIGNLEGFEVLLVGDVFYESQLASAVTQWIFECHARGLHVFVGDVGRQFFPKERFRLLRQFAIADSPIWDSVTGREAGVWTL